VEVSEEYDYYDYDYECEIININKVKIWKDGIYD
jgi:hypothetical protein